MTTEEIILPASPTATRAVSRCDAPTVGGLLQHVPSARNDASFVAQLLATADNLPQTRHRRRAEPREAVAAYSLPQVHAPACGQTRRVA